LSLPEFHFSLSLWFLFSCYPVRVMRESAALPAALPLTVLEEDEQMFRESVRRFTRERLAPQVRAMDEAGKFAPELLREMFALGLMGIHIDEEYGGQGGSFFQAILAIEELAKVDPSASVIVDVQNTLVSNAIARWGTATQKKQYLSRLAADTVGAYALSEPGSGSDAFSLTTRAIRDGSEYRLNGRKQWITNAAEAGVFLLFATVDPGAGYRGITCFLIERDTPGFTVGRKEDKLGIRASSTCELILEDVRVSSTQILGEIGQGYRVAMETLNEGRIGIGAQMLGLAEGALEHALRYANERKQFGKPIGEFQGIQFQLAEMATRVEAARLMVYNAARLRDAGKPYLAEAAMAKFFSSIVAEEVASQAIEIYGGVGFTKDYPVEKLYRDAKIGRIYEGTSNMLRLTIAKSLLQRAK
jgi:alkylation response protein AidB-like acyl-CoA dehydrogenase